jgi:hypothetical protein
MCQNWRQQCMLLSLILAYSLILGISACEQQQNVSQPERPITSLEPFSNLTFWMFKRNVGDGIMDLYKNTNGDFIKFEGFGERGMAATINTLPLKVKPGYEYIVTMDIKTENLEPVTARLVGAAYFYFNDLAGRPAGFYPAVALYGPPALIAPRDTDWKTVTQVIKTPTTAGSARLFLAFGAYGTWDEGHPRETGRARGSLWIRNLKVELGDKISVLPATIHVPDKTIQSGIETVTACFHNVTMGDKILVSDGYSISGNIVPDITFGLFGARRLGHPRYMQLVKNHWKMFTELVKDDGKITNHRVMSHVLFPIGVDEIFSFTGEFEFLSEFLPLADRVLEYVIKRGDENGLTRMVDYGQWRIGEGADWVDWYPTRMEGKTFNFHQWYVRALRRIAALHEEFSNNPDPTKNIGNIKKANLYLAQANRVEASLRKLYWREDHFIPNIDYGGKIVEQKWCDDQVWAIRWDIATPEQKQKIWEWIDANPVFYEGVPMRWAAFEGPQHGGLSWFGRSGAGDILARYHSGNSKRGLELIQRISEIFVRDSNVYEAYDMDGNVVLGTDGWGNYTEHSGGYIWSLIEGPFGITFDSDSVAKATINHRIPESWNSATAVFYIRGTRVLIKYKRTGKNLQLNFDANGPLQPIRIILQDGKSKVMKVGTGGIQQMQL